MAEPEYTPLDVAFSDAELEQLPPKALRLIIGKLLAISFGRISESSFWRLKSANSGPSLARTRPIPTSRLRPTNPSSSLAQAPHLASSGSFRSASPLARRIRWARDELRRLCKMAKDPPTKAEWNAFMPGSTG